VTRTAAWVDKAYGVRIGRAHVRMRVQGRGEPLLLLNGATRPLESWDPLAQALPGRTLVSFDAPGAGLSPTPMWPMTMPALARLAASVLDEAELGRADVLGFSHGGAVAQQLAAQDPGRVRKLVLVSTACGVGATPGTRDAVTALRNPPGARWPRPDLVGALWHSLAISSWSSIPFLGSITAPTLVVCGSRDRVVPPVNSRVLAHRVPGAELVVLDAGHDLQRQRVADDLASVVGEFLGRP